jgi:hypothetical protein
MSGDSLYFATFYSKIARGGSSTVFSGVWKCDGVGIPRCTANDVLESAIKKRRPSLSVLSPK